ncbi:MAG TPA: hypothetical protein VMW91_01450 [Desulfosporosinus sp.]|nr:hypothetical protein [Desulfosporosinus sp.]
MSNVKKFELTSEVKMYFGTKLFRIKALIKFGDVDAEELGGWIEKEGNLDQSGNAWVYGDAWVSGDARVFGDAWVSGDARVYGDAWVSGDARVCGNARVFGDAWVSGDARVKKITHLLQIGLIGSRNATTTFFRAKTNQIYVACGCFLGDMDTFEKAVHEKHGGTKHEKTYMLAIELAKAQIELDEANG